MRPLLTLTLLSVFALPGLSRAAEPGAAGAHPVAAEPHAARLAPEAVQPAQGSPADGTAPATRQAWYGWQTLAADGAALLLLIAAGASSDQQSHLSDVFGYGAVGMYLLGGPVTHFAHDNPGRGLGSLALRAGVPVAFAAVGYNLEDCSGDNSYDLCGFAGLALGGVLGIATAITIDAAALSYEEVPVTPEGLQNVGLSIGRDHAALVAGGTF